MHFVLVFTVFCASLQGSPGGGQEQVFLRVMFSAFVHLHWFLQCFSRIRTFFFAPCAFSLGFYRVFWLHDVAAATLDIGVGWGGDVNVPYNLLTWLMLRHAGVGGMLTFHATFSRG